MADWEDVEDSGQTDPVAAEDFSVRPAALIIARNPDADAGSRWSVEYQALAEGPNLVRRSVGNTYTLDQFLTALDGQAGATASAKLRALMVAENAKVQSQIKP